MLKALRKKIIIQAGILYIRGITKLALLQPKKKSQASDLHKVYTSIVGLPFDRFLDYYLNGNYDALIRKEYAGNSVDILDLVRTGEKLYLQYLDACGGSDNNHYLSLVGGIAKQESRLERISVLVALLKVKYDERWVKELKQLGIRTQIRTEHIDEDLDRVLVDAKRFVLDINTKHKSLEALQNKSVEPDMDMYYNILAHKDPKIMISDIDTMMFCTIYREIKAKYKALEKQQRNG